MSESEESDVSMDRLFSEIDADQNDVLRGIDDKGEKSNSVQVNRYLENYS